MKPAAQRRLQDRQGRVGATPDHVHAMVDAIVDGLGDAPQTQQELVARREEDGEPRTGHMARSRGDSGASGGDRGPRRVSARRAAPR